MLILTGRAKREQARASALIFIHKSISEANLPYREAVRDHSPGLLDLGFCHKEFALKAERAVECDCLSTWIASYSFSPVPVGRPFRAHFDGAFPGLKAWAENPPKMSKLQSQA